MRLPAFVVAAALLLISVPQAQQTNWLAPGKIDSFDLCIREDCLDPIWPTAGLVATVLLVDPTWTMLEIQCRNSTSGEDMLMARGTGAERITVATQIWPINFSSCKVSVHNWDETQMAYHLSVGALAEQPGKSLPLGRKTTRDQPITRGPDADADAGADNPDNPPTPGSSADPRFDDEFWRQLVYNGFEKPVDLAGRRSWMLREPMNVFIKTTDETGRDVLGDWDAKLHGDFHLWDWAREWSGREMIEDIFLLPSHPLGRDALGWITIEPYSTVEAFHDDESVCGTALVGGDPGLIKISMESRCVSGGRFGELVLHELGHALGFRHVDSVRFPGSVMANGPWAGVHHLSPREQYHGELAYDIGRGASYCGWPYGDNCPRRNALGFGDFRLPSGPPPLAID